MAKDPKEYGFEGEMAMSQLKGIMQHAKQLHGMLKPDTDLPEWVQSKITLSYDYLQTAADYMSTEMNEGKEFYADAKRRAKADMPQEKLSPAWKSKARARATAAGRKYPNLVDNVWAARMQESVNEEVNVDKYADSLIKRDKQNLSKRHVVHAARVAGVDHKKLLTAVQMKVGRIKEETEEVQIDELSSDTLKSYKTKAFADARSTDDDRRARKRMTGAHKASFKVSKREMDSSYKEDLPNMLKDLRSKKKSHANMRREYGGSWKRLQSRTAAEHGYNYNRDHLLQVGQKHMEEEAPANSVGGGKIAGMGVGAQGEPGVGPKAMKRYKDKNAAEAPKTGRKAFSLFMQGN
jgi:hypothetical protein